MSTAELLVACEPLAGGGWRCSVTVGDDPDATSHSVQVDRATLEDLAPGAMPEDLVRASFEFLLEREPRESIMRSFELPVIGRFFGDYADTVSVDACSESKYRRSLAWWSFRAESGRSIG